MQHTTIHISIRTILSILGFALGIFLIIQLWNIVLILFAALVLAALIDPFASWFAQKKVPRGVAVLIVYVLLIGLLFGAISLLVPVLSRDVPQLIDRLQLLMQDVQETPQFASLQNNLEQLGISFDSARNSSGADATNRTLNSVYGAVSNVFEGIASLILILVIAFYMVVEEDSLQKIVYTVVPKDRVKHVVFLLNRIREKLALWIRGQLILSIIIGVFTFIGLSLLGVRYAAALALIAALLEFIPYLGPIIASIPAFIIAFTQGGVVLFLVTLVFYVLIQQLENHILAPKIMQRAVGLNPIVSIIAILIGAQIAGVIGALIAIPFATAVSVILNDVINQKETT